MSFDTDYTAVPVCPHCGAKDEDWWEHIEDEDGLDVTCGRCRLEYHVEVHRSIEFTTSTGIACPECGELGCTDCKDDDAGEEVPAP